MRTQGVMLSVRISDACMTELKRVEKDCFGFTRSKLVKEALQLLFDKFPDRSAAKKHFPLLPNGESICSLHTKDDPKKKPKKKPKLKPKK